MELYGANSNHTPFMLANIFEDMFFEALTKGIVTAGLPAMLLGFAAWWLQKQWARSQEEAEVRQKELQEEASKMQQAFIAELNKERSERITLLESKVSECEEDRKDLRRQLLEYFKAAAKVVQSAGNTTTQPIPPLIQS